MLPVHAPRWPDGGESPTLPAATRDLRLLPLPRRAATRAALDLPRGAPARYSLYGMDELVGRGHAVGHNLERAGPSHGARMSAARSSGASRPPVGTAATSPRSSRRGESSNAQTSFHDIGHGGAPARSPRARRLLRPPFVYAASGCPSVSRGSARAGSRALCARARRCVDVVAYSEPRRTSRHWTRARRVDAHVEFVPFGVDVGLSRRAMRPRVTSSRSAPIRSATSSSVLGVARGHAGRASSSSRPRARPHARGPPAKSTVEADLPFEEMRRCLERARVVALPVRENSYSGATTVLLQAIALAKPVVVTQTAAIADGYGLEDGQNVRLVAPGDAASFGGAIRELLRDDEQAAASALRARDGGVRAHLGAVRGPAGRSARDRRPLTAITRASCAAPRDARSPRG